MSQREFWAQVLPKEKKAYVLHYLAKLDQPKRKKIRTLLVELTIPSIEDPLKDQYLKIFNNYDSYNDLDAIRHFVDKSPYWWHVREWARFIVGHHRPIPSASFNLYANFAGHFPHISREDESRIAIVMDMKKAEADMHTTMKIGRYLSKQTNAPESAIPDISNEYANRTKTYTLEEARTKAEIQWVYENGPTSCMAKTMTQGIFLTQAHPTHAYATPDIKILFVRDLQDHSRIISRTVASAINNTYVRIFGNEPVIQKLLDEAGIKRNRYGGLTNHRLLKITEKRNGVTMHVGPYLDSGKEHITEDPNNDKYLIIGDTQPQKERGKHIGHTEQSYSGKGFIDTPPTITCNYCGSAFNEDAIQFYELSAIYACESCRDDHMISLYDATLSRTYVDSDYPDTYTTKITSGKQLYKYASSKTQSSQHTTKMQFINEQAFRDAELPQYRDQENLYITPDNAVWIQNRGMYVCFDEAQQLSYCNKTYLIEDCIKINNKLIAKEHIQNSEFKFNTLDGYNLQDISDNLSAYYFKYISLNTSHDSLAIISVSKKIKPGYMSLNDFWLQRIENAHGFNEYAHVKAAELIRLSISLCVIPDDPEHILFKENSSHEYLRFRTSTFAARRMIKIPPSNTQVVIKNSSRLKANRIVRKKKKKHPTDAYATNGITWTTL